MTRLLLGLDWASHFPLDLGEGRSFQFAAPEAGIRAFVRLVERDRAQIAVAGRETSGYSVSLFPEDKLRYYLNCGDFFTYHTPDSEEPAGIFVGTPIDWSSYYFRSFLFAREQQGRGHSLSIMRHLSSILARHGVARIDADVAPSNHKSIHIFNKLGFRVSGLLNTDRWGEMIHFTQYLNASAGTGPAEYHGRN